MNVITEVYHTRLFIELYIKHLWDFQDNIELTKKTKVSK